MKKGLDPVNKLMEQDDLDFQPLTDSEREILEKRSLERVTQAKSNALREEIRKTKQAKSRGAE